MKTSRSQNKPSSRSAIMDRRRFLQGMGGTGVLASTWGGAMSSLMARADEPDPDGPILVLLHLAGGNDVLNTVVPVDTEGSIHYYAGRNELALDAGDVLPLQGGYGLHPHLQQIKSLWDQGDLAIVNGVGNPNQILSHFKSIDIWESGSPEALKESGWLGRYFQHRCSEEGSFDSMIGVDVRETASLAYLTPESDTTLTLSNPEFFEFLSREKELPSDPDFDRLLLRGMAEGLVSRGSSEGKILQYVTSSLKSALEGSDSIQASLGAADAFDDKTVFPSTKLGRDLQNIAGYISGGLPSSTYFLTQGGYDTHADQVQLNGEGKPLDGRHAVLLAQFDEAMGAFVGELKKRGVWNRVTVVAYSEFSRKVLQNGNMGTDHGAAGSVFVTGGQVKEGFYGEYPSLAPDDLILNNSMPVTTDFRRVYRTILERGLGVDVAAAAELLRVPSDEFLPLDFL